MGTSPSSSGVAVDRFYRPELDALRFFAFLAVYMNHTLIYDPSRGAAWKRILGGVGTAGAFGVDLFFVLSAYLITELLLREIARTGTLDVGAFYARRILRIWPLYFFFLGAMLVVAHFRPEEHMTPAYAAGFALFWGNWLYMAHPIRTMAAPLWSVSVEEQFYLLWPWVIRRRTAGRIARVAVGLLCLAILTRLGLQLAGTGEPWISKNSLGRADGIAAGVLLAVVLRGRMPRLATRPRALLLAGSIIGLVVIGGTFDLFKPGVRALREASGYALVALCCTGILVAVLGLEGALGAALRRRSLVYLGRISYGLYVFHQVGLLIADEEIPGYSHHVRRWAAHFALGLAITLLIAPISYHLLERPFLRLKRKRFTVVESRPELGRDDGQPGTERRAAESSQPPAVVAGEHAAVGITPASEASRHRDCLPR